MNRYIRIITVIGLIAIVLVQFIWLSSSYQAIKNNLVRESNILFKEAVDREIFIRIDSINPSEDIIMSQESTDDGELVIQTEYLQEAALKYGSDISLQRLDKIFTALLLEKEMSNSVRINKIMILNDSIIGYMEKRKLSHWDIKTKQVPIRLDQSIGVQAILENPIASVFKRMGLLMIATIILMLFVRLL